MRQQNKYLPYIERRSYAAKRTEAPQQLFALRTFVDDTDKQTHSVSSILFSAFSS